MERSRMERSILRFTIAASALHLIIAYQMHFIPEPKTWMDAQTYCREHFTDLEPLKGKLLKQLARQNNVDSQESNENPESETVWIGLYDDPSNWRWSLSDSDFYRDGEAEFRGWGNNQPNEYKHFDYCAIITASGIWRDSPCESSFKFICADVNGQNVTFIHVDILMTWMEAQTYCREHHTDLASVRNKEENDRITELIPQKESAWIGLSRSPWMWVDGRKVTETKLKRRKVSEKCGAQNIASFTIEALNCAQELPFICFSDSKYVVKLKLVTNSFLDLNDPAVQEGILRQLKQKLIDHRGTENFKLTWKKHSGGNSFNMEKKADGL